MSVEKISSSEDRSNWIS